MNLQEVAWLDNIPAVLRERDQWVCWNLVARDSKPTKVPCQTDGSPASSTDPQTWTSFATARAAAPPRFSGIGFVFTPDDPYCGVDLDHAREPHDGSWDSTSWPYFKALRSYTEVTPSHTGFHVIVEAQLGKGIKRQPRGHAGPVELYDRGRFFTMTGNHLPGTPQTVEARQRTVDALIEMLTREDRKAVPLQRVGRAPQWDVDTVLRRALEATNGNKLRALWLGGGCGYSSESEADLAFCSLLAFWTESGAVLDAAFRRSDRMRPKWDEQRGEATYGEVTIAQALANGARYQLRS